MAEPAPASDDIRTRLLDAAGEVFAERGYAGAGVAEIARRAGLTTGAIYSRYSGKAGLLLEAIEQASSAELRALLYGSAPEPPTDVLAAVGTHLVDPEPPRGQALMLEAFVAARRDPDVAALLQRRIEDQDLQLAKLVGEAKAQGAIDPALDTDAVVTFCHSVALGFLLYRAIDRPLPSPREWAAVIDRLVLAARPLDPGGNDGRHPA